MIGEYINDESLNKDGIAPNYFSKESMPKARPLTSNTGNKSQTTAAATRMNQRSLSNMRRSKKALRHDNTLEGVDTRGD